MATELQFQRETPGTPWGFRLTGGADLDIPLTVIKVAEKSVAEEVGMKVGDMLVRIGNTATAGLSHLQAHDLIRESGNCFAAAVIRGDLPEHFTETEESIDSETTHNGISQSLQINIKTNVVDTTKIIVESGEVIQQNIKINGAVVSDQQDNVQLDITIDKNKENNSETSQQSQINSERILEVSQEKDALASSLEKLMESSESIKGSEVLKVIKEEVAETKEDKRKQQEKKWTTFLQKPKRPKPKIKKKESEQFEEPPYRVIIQKQKRKKDAAKAAESSSQGSTPLPDEMVAQTPELTSEQEFELQEKQIQEEQEELAEEKKYEEGDHPETIDVEVEPVISEVEMSLEDQLAAIQRQLMALSQLPAAIQNTLDAVTQQLTKIVGPVNDPNREENIHEDYQDNSLEEAERDTEDQVEGLETLEEVSESGFDKDSQHGGQEGEDGLEEALEEIAGVDNFEGDQIEPELAMLEETPEPEDLTPEEREARRAERAKVDKKQKINHWNNIWPWGDHLGKKIYRDSNTHLIPSKALGEEPINFLKYEPPPKTLDHLKNSEVYKMIHDMDPPVRGVGARSGKAVSEEDYYEQVNNNSDGLQTASEEVPEPPPPPQKKKVFDKSKLLEHLQFRMDYRT